MKKILSNQEKFELAISKILAQQYSESVGKAQVTKILNQWEKEEDCETIKKITNAVLAALDIPTWANWVQQRFTCVLGSYWLESSSKYGDNVLGWYDSKQIQAESLPLKLWYQQFEDERYCEVLGWGGKWEAKGFVEAISIPLTLFDRKVKVPLEEIQFYCEHGYASPCELQWERVINRVHTETNGYYVTRSIIPCGFWQAWKWWPGCWQWYYKNRPELFSDAEWWGLLTPIRHEPPDNLYAAVLGGKNKHKIITFSLDS